MVYKVYINKAVKKKNKTKQKKKRKTDCSSTGKKKYEDSKMNVTTQAKFICQHVNTRISQ